MESLLEQSPSHSCSLPSAGLNVSSQTVHPSPTKTIQMPTKKIVERCFLMNLDRRDDRLHEWMQQLPQPWPFPDVERFAAIDGRRLATPEQWRAGNGAWGCYPKLLVSGTWSDELTVYDERLTSLDETFSSHLVLTRFLIRLGVNARRFKLRIKEGDDATLQLARS
jgi:hypothetical protein